MYTPQHPIIAAALRAAAAAVLSTFKAHAVSDVINMTGPTRLHEGGVVPVLKRNGCAISIDSAASEGLQLVKEGRPCEQMLQPEPIGVVQVRGGPSERLS